MTMYRYIDALQQYVVMETVVTGKGDQSPPSDGHREENLDGRVLPNLYDVKIKIPDNIRKNNYLYNIPPPKSILIWFILK